MRVVLLLTLALGSGACRAQPTEVENVAGTLSVSWTGHATGRFQAPARGAWCPADSMLQIEAIRGDTGVSLALFEKDTLARGQHPVVAPEVMVSWRPLAGAALRWFNDSEVLGFSGSGGVVSVTSTDSGATGTIDVRLRAANQMDTLHLSGTFTGISVEPAVGACGRVSKATAG